MRKVVISMLVVGALFPGLPALACSRGAHDIIFRANPAAVPKEFTVVRVRFRNEGARFQNHKKQAPFYEGLPLIGIAELSGLKRTETIFPVYADITGCTRGGFFGPAKIDSEVFLVGRQQPKGGQPFVAVGRMTASTVGWY